MISNLSCVFLIHFKLNFVCGIKDLIVFICMWVSTFPSLIYGRDYPLNIVYYFPWTYECISVVFFFSFLVFGLYPMGLREPERLLGTELGLALIMPSALLPVLSLSFPLWFLCWYLLYYFGDNNFEIQFAIRNFDLSSFIPLSQDCSVTWNVPWFQKNVSIDFSIFVKKDIGTLR